jgi:hypothetical protein
MDLLKTSQICTRCKYEKEPEEFSHKASWCKTCKAAYAAAYRQKNPEKARESIMTARSKKVEFYKEANRKAHLKRKYDLTIEQYDDMARAQDFVCAICREPFKLDSLDRGPCVDHCHETGRVRGILCWDCNRGLGGFKDNLQSLQEAINYLGRGK